MLYSTVQTLRIKLYLHTHGIQSKYSSIGLSLPSPAFPDSKTRLPSSRNNHSNGSKSWAVAFGAINCCEETWKLKLWQTNAGSITHVFFARWWMFPSCTNWGKVLPAPAVLSWAVIMLKFLCKRFTQWCWGAHISKCGSIRVVLSNGL